jgi:WS/DGAT/MGAT family acyltransferase
VNAVPLALATAAAPGTHWEASLLSALEGPDPHGIRIVRRCVDILELFAAAGTAQIDAVLVDPGLRHLDSAAVERLAAHGVGVVGVTSADHAADTDRLRSAGVSHVIPHDVGPAIVATVVQSAMRDLAADKATALHGFAVPDRWAELDADASGGPVSDGFDDPTDIEYPGGAGGSPLTQGSVVAVWGPVGSPGRTTLSIGLADELARLRERTLLIDADTYGGVVAPALGFLDESPGLAAACRQAQSQRLDAAVLSGLAWRLNPCLQVLTGLSRADRWPELRPVGVRRTLRVARTLADYVVVDLGFCLETDEELSFDSAAPRRNGATLAVLDEADLVLAVGAADPIGIQRMARAMSELRQLELRAPTWIVMNRVRRGVVPGTPQTDVAEAVRRFIGLDAAAMLPFDQESLDGALSQGLTLGEWAPASPLRRAQPGTDTGRVGACQPVAARRCRTRGLDCGRGGAKREEEAPPPSLNRPPAVRPNSVPRPWSAPGRRSCQDRQVADRLSALDASFLLMEGSATPMHIGSLDVFARPASGFSYDTLTSLIGQRISLAPRYRQRIRQMPGRLGSPVWIDDAHFDLGYHVRRLTLPGPGTQEQLNELVARVQSRPLDRTRPLWEVYLVEGLSDGRFALITKTHHAMFDASRAVELSQVIFDVTPVPRVVRSQTWQPAPVPSNTQLLVDAVTGAVQRPGAVWDSVRAALTDAEAVVHRFGSVISGLLVAARLVARPAPSSILNTPGGTARRYAIARTDLDDYRRIRRQTGSTVNDVVLATVAGALRGWMLAREQPVTPSTVVRALTPLSVRHSDDAKGHQPGTRVASYLIDLPVGEPNPLVRLAQVSYAMRAHTESGQSVGADRLIALSGFAPPTLHALGARVASSFTRRLFNVVVTNVPGPQFPLYAAGARLLEMYPVSPLAPGQAVSVGLTSYDGGIYFGLNGDRDVMYDLGVLAALIEESLAELLEASDASQRPIRSRVERSARPAGR